MRSFKHLLFLIVLSTCLTAPLAFSLEIPKRPDGYVTDHAGVLSPQTKSKLESALRAYENKTSNQVVVAIFKSLEGGALEDFSIKLAEAWKVGQSEKDNGVILLVFKDDRKIRIEVGYGLEGALPDALAGQIIGQVITPYFKKGDYEAGVLAGISGIIKATQGEYKAVRQSSYGRSNYRRPLTPEEAEALRKKGLVFLAGASIFLLILFIADLFRYRGYAKRHRIYKKSYSFWEWFFRFAVLLAVLSIIFRMLFYAMLFSRGGYHGSRGGFGGFSGGGGSFGGGGASGGW